MKTIAFIFRQTPLGGSLSREAIDMALATASFDQNVKVIFLGDGVWQLIKSQAGTSMMPKRISKMLSSFEMFGIDSVHVDEQSLAARAIDINTLIDTIPLQITSDITRVIDSANHVVTF